MVPDRLPLLIAAATLAACGVANPTPTPPPTFHEDVEPILQQHCDGCHVAGGIAPFALTTYQDAFPYARDMAMKTGARQMPPWDAIGTPDCQPRLAWKNDNSLTADQIATIGAWAQGGALEGNPANAPPPPPTSGDSGLTGVSLDLAPSTPFDASGAIDEFRCFVLDPKLTQAVFVNGAYAIPGNRAVVHHVVLLTDPTRASAALADASGSYDCFGGVSNLPQASVLAVWTPGAVPFELPSNMGTPVPANSLFVMQVHYHPHSTVAGPETTHVQLRFASSTPTWYVATVGIGNYPTQLPDGDGLQPAPDDPTAQFRVPANVAGHVETMRFTVPALVNGNPLPPLHVVGAMAHMHLIGTDLEIQVQHPAGSSECLLHEPQWNFDWQRMYLYDADVNSLPVVNPGDQVFVRCTYDNTTSNPGVLRELSDTGQSAPQDVYLGEQTTNEMCLGILPLAYYVP